MDYGYDLAFFSLSLSLSLFLSGHWSMVLVRCVLCGNPTCSQERAAQAGRSGWIHVAQLHIGSAAAALFTVHVIERLHAIRRGERQEPRGRS